MNPFHKVAAKQTIRIRQNSKMKVTSIATIVLFASLGHAWRFRGYQNRNYGGAETTSSGPGAAGSACHSVGALNEGGGQISSYKWYNDGGCRLVLYKGISCTDRVLARHTTNVEIPDLANAGYNDDISSYETVCT